MATSSVGFDIFLKHFESTGVYFFNHQLPARDQINHKDLLARLLVHPIEQFEQNVPRGSDAALLDLVGQNG